MRNSIAAAGLALTLAGCAATPGPAGTPQESQTPAAAKVLPLGCVTGTGTRLPVKPDECTGFGSVHTKTALDSTGTPYAQQSLQMLDTAVKTNGRVVP